MHILWTRVLHAVVVVAANSFSMENLIFAKCEMYDNEKEKVWITLQFREIYLTDSVKINIYG